MDRELTAAEVDARMDELKRACRLREETVRHPTNCIHQAWHDLKECLHVIRVGGTLLKAKASDDDGRNLADFITSASTDLNQLLVDLPDYARLESGNEKRNLTSFQAPAAFRDVPGNLRPILEAKRVTLKLEGSPALAVEGDLGKVQRITENLVRYCIKQGHPQEVRIAWKAEPPRNWSISVQCAATTAEETPALPERISLAVARGFCQILDGTLSVEAAPGSISCSVKLPVAYGT